MTKYFYLFPVLLFFLSQLHGQDVLTFDEAIRIAMTNNHQIQVARYDAETARNNVHIGNAGLLPRVDLTANANYSDSENQTSVGSVNESSTANNAQVQANYTLFDGFGNIYRFEKLKALGQMGDLMARNNIENTLYRTAGAFYATALTSENLHIAEELAAISKERLERSKSKSQFGQANTIQVLAAQVDLNADSVTLAQAQLQWEEAERDLNVLLNRDVDTPVAVDSSVAFLTDIDIDNLKNRALSNNASYLIAENRYDQSSLDLKTARSVRLPKLDLTASYGYSQFNPDFDIGMSDPDRTFRMGASFSFNLFNGFQNQIKIQNAKIEQKTQKLLQEEAQLYLTKQITDAHETYQKALFILQLEKRNLNAADLNFKRTDELFHLGQVTNTQFREAQLNLVRALSNISTAKYTAKLNEIELLRLSGMLITE